MRHHLVFPFIIASIVMACGGSVETSNGESDSGVGGSGGGVGGTGGGGTGGGEVGGGGTGGGEVGGGGTGGGPTCVGDPAECSDSCVGTYPAVCTNGAWQCWGAPNANLDCVDPCTGSLTPPVCSNGAWGCANYACADAGTACPQLPSCNWCDGLEVFDAEGCVIGFRCWNGVDPCQTDPCQSEGDCANMQEHCSNGLCSTTGPVSCSESCNYNSDGTNLCEWYACSDGKTYASDCSPMPNSGNWQCECLVDSEPTSSCYWNNQGGAGGPSDYGNVCCPFPWP